MRSPSPRTSAAGSHDWAAFQIGAIRAASARVGPVEAREPAQRLHLPQPVHRDGMVERLLEPARDVQGAHLEVVGLGRHGRCERLPFRSAQVAAAGAGAVVVACASAVGDRRPHVVGVVAQQPPQRLLARASQQAFDDEVELGAVVDVVEVVPVLSHLLLDLSR